MSQCAWVLNSFWKWKLQHMLELIKRHVFTEIKLLVTMSDKKSILDTQMPNKVVGFFYLGDKLCRLKGCCNEKHESPYNNGKIRKKETCDTPWMIVRPWNPCTTHSSSFWEGSSVFSLPAIIISWCNYSGQIFIGLGWDEGGWMVMW